MTDNPGQMRQVPTPNLNSSQKPMIKYVTLKPMGQVLTSNSNPTIKYVTMKLPSNQNLAIKYGTPKPVELVQPPNPDSNTNLAIKYGTPKPVELVQPPNPDSNTNLAIHKKMQKTKVQSEKLFKCTLCEKSFCTKPGLNNHNSTKHLKITHECSICQKLYATKYNYLIHMKSLHPNNPVDPKMVPQQKKTALEENNSNNPAQHEGDDQYKHLLFENVEMTIENMFKSASKYSNDEPQTVELENNDLMQYDEAGPSVKKTKMDEACTNSKPIMIVPPSPQSSYDNLLSPSSVKRSLISNDEPQTVELENNDLMQYDEAGPSVKKTKMDAACTNSKPIMVVPPSPQSSYDDLLSPSSVKRPLNASTSHNMIINGIEPLPKKKCPCCGEERESIKGLETKIDILTETIKELEKSSKENFNASKKTYEMSVSTGLKVGIANAQLSELNQRMAERDAEYDATKVNPFFKIANDEALKLFEDGVAQDNRLLSNMISHAAANRLHSSQPDADDIMAYLLKVFNRSFLSTFGKKSFAATRFYTDFLQIIWTKKGLDGSLLYKILGEVITKVKDQVKKQGKRDKNKQKKPNCDDDEATMNVN